MWGKAKTVAQMASVIYILSSQYLLSLYSTDMLINIINIITNVVLWASAVLTVISGAVYVKQNKQFIDPKK